MTELQEEVLTKLQLIHDLIEQHPFLSSMVTSDFHNYLDYVVENARELNGINIDVWRDKPSEDMIEKHS